jgi:hypothetical protein
LLSAGEASAQRADPREGQGGSLPLADVMVVAKAYPNLITEIRLRLIAAGMKKEAVICTARRLSNDWPALSGQRIGPYTCTIGKRTLSITSEQTFRDRNGYKIGTGDPQLAKKATQVAESRLKWIWK